MASHESSVNLSVRVPADGFEDDDDGNEELLLLVQNSQVDVAVSDIM